MFVIFNIQFIREAIVREILNPMIGDQLYIVSMES